MYFTHTSEHVVHPIENQVQLFACHRATMTQRELTRPSRKLNGPGLIAEYNRQDTIVVDFKDFISSFFKVSRYQLNPVYNVLQVVLCIHYTDTTKVTCKYHDNLCQNISEGSGGHHNSLTERVRYRHILHPRKSGTKCQHRGNSRLSVLHFKWKSMQSVCCRPL